MKRFLPLILLLALPVPATQGASGASAPLRLVQTIPLPGVEGRFDHFALDAKGERLFVAALGNNTLEVLDLKAGRVARSARGLREPQGVAFAPDLGLLFVGNGGSGDCTVLDGKTLAPAGRVGALDDADNVRYDAASRQVYVGYGTGGLSVIDGNSRRQVGQIRLAAHPESFQLERSGPRIYVNVPGAGQVAVVDRVRRAVVATWPLGGSGANFPMALDEAGHRLFVGCRRPARMVVFDTTSGKQVANAQIAGDTDDLFYDPARKQLYAACGEGFLSVLRQKDADHYEPLARIATAPGARTGFFSPDRGRFYLAVPHRGGQGAEIRVYAMAQ
jgi:DNA-binding beta-propeller fold protein YncE